MTTNLKDHIAYLTRLGIDEVPHTQKSFLAHVVAVHDFLKERGCEVDVCLAGLFHSIYGTQSFQSFKLPLDKRAELRDMIGERAERLAYWNCAMDRESFDKAVLRGTPPFTIRDRLSGQSVELTDADFDDLCRVHLFDWLEQVARSEKWGWNHRRAAYRAMAERLGGVAIESFDRVYANEPANA